MRTELGQIWRAGVAACHPAQALPAHLPHAPATMVAIGKAAGAMAEVVEARWGAAARGIAIVPHGTEARLERIALIHAGHPVPDAASVAAARRALALADASTLVLLSGGASALACLPGAGLALAEKQAVTRALLRSGAAIGEVNCVRRHLSKIKGGRLPAALTLAISDVAGDAPEDIGSGPTVADRTTIADAREVLARYGIAAPAMGWSESAKRTRGVFRIVARPGDALAAAAAEARRLGYRPEILGLCADDAHATGIDHARRALAAASGTALISGGELGSPHRGGGSGGRNHVYALGAAATLRGHPNIAGLAADTDGLDGSAGAAGAWFDGTTLERSRDDAAAMLASAASADYFSRLGDQFVTGPTGTNVSDLRIILVSS